VAALLSIGGVASYWMFELFGAGCKGNKSAKLLIGSEPYLISAARNRYSNIFYLS